MKVPVLLSKVFLGPSVLLLGVIVFVSSTAKPIRASSEAVCHFQSISVTAGLESSYTISDTQPGSVLDRNIYYGEVNAFTVTSVVTPANQACFVTGSPGFGTPTERLFTTTMGNPAIDIPYTIDSAIVQTIALTTAVARESADQVVSLVFMPDNTPPVVTVTLPAQSGTGNFKVSWTASDADSDLRDYSGWYQRDNDFAPTQWFVNKLYNSKDFTAPALNHLYVFTITARDWTNNIGTGSRSIWVGPYHIFLPLILHDYPVVWKLGSGTSGLSFRTPTGCNNTNTWYVGTPGTGGVWRSTNNARDWSYLGLNGPDNYPVLANSANCNQAFTTVWGGGVISLSAGQQLAINNGLTDPYLYTLVMTNSVLYAGTNSQGVFKTATNTIAWQNISGNMDDRRVRTLYTSGNTLYAGTRGCKIYRAALNSNTWAFETIKGAGCNDAQVWALQQVRTTLYAGLGLDNGLYYRIGNGAWQLVANIPAKSVLGLAYDNAHNILYASAYGAGVYQCRLSSLDGSPQACAPYNVGLTTLATREMHISNNTIVVSSDSGLWYMPLFQP